LPDFAPANGDPDRPEKDIIKPARNCGSGHQVKMYFKYLEILTGK
jgi:hypothetical protein